MLPKICNVLGKQIKLAFLFGTLIKKHGTAINQDLKVNFVVWFWSGRTDLQKHQPVQAVWAQTGSSIWTSWRSGLLMWLCHHLAVWETKMEPFNFPQGQTKACNTAAMITTTTDARAICQRTISSQCRAAASRLQSLIPAKLISPPGAWWISWIGMKCIPALGCIQHFLCVSNLNF